MGVHRLKTTGASRTHLRSHPVVSGMKGGVSATLECSTNWGEAPSSLHHHVLLPPRFHSRCDLFPGILHLITTLAGLLKERKGITSTIGKKRLELHFHAPKPYSYSVYYSKLTVCAGLVRHKPVTG
jgi:hypothetical protein